MVQRMATAAYTIFDAEDLMRNSMKLQLRCVWLREVRGAYCDYCIAKELRLSRRQANRIANALSAKANFCRERGVCSLCGAEKKVIAAV
jgi:hypothetical protein